MAGEGRQRMASMELGAQVPAWHWDLEVSELRDWVQGVEAIGYDWIAATDHVMYAYETAARPAAGPYVGATIQHEVLTTLAYLAACSSRLILTSSVLVLPQRQPVLVAKQAAELDILSGGRFRLGVGTGWQEAEFASLGTPFRQRPSRMEEAVAVLRACWSEEPVRFEGRYTTVREMSMLPKPVTPGGPPILFGGAVPAAEERAARLGDGWIGLSRVPPEGARESVQRIKAHLAKNGRDAAAFPIQWTTPLREDVGGLIATFAGYREAGASRLGVSMPSNDPGAKLPVDEYLRQLEVVFREVWPAVRG